MALGILLWNARKALNSLPVAESLAQWTPRPLPSRDRALSGERVDLAPLDPAAHGAVLWEVSHNDVDPHLWDYLFYGPFPNLKHFHAYLDRMTRLEGHVFYAIVDKKSGRPGGIASYLRMEPDHGVIEIGHIWFGIEMQRTPASTEAMYVMAKHVFDDLGYRRLEWKCDAANDRSRRAAARLGFSFDGIFPQNMIIKGRNRDTAWYSMLDRDWPVNRKAFELWLAPENFDQNGLQLQSLGAIRRKLKQTFTEAIRSDVVIRDAMPGDEADWRQMWQAYNEFYESIVPTHVTDFTWKRILDPEQPIGSLIALADGEIAGFANYVVGPYTWSDRPKCLMEDLFVRPEARSGGVGRALIEALLERARSQGWTEVYWITKHDNLRARRLYESLTPPDGFIQYTLELND